MSSSLVLLLRQAGCRRGRRPDGEGPGPCSSAAAVHDIGGECPLVDDAGDLAGDLADEFRESLKVPLI